MEEEEQTIQCLPALSRPACEPTMSIQAGDTTRCFLFKQNHTPAHTSSVASLATLLLDLFFFQKGEKFGLFLTNLYNFVIKSPSSGHAKARGHTN